MATKDDVIHIIHKHLVLDNRSYMIVSIAPTITVVQKLFVVVSLFTDNFMKFFLCDFYIPPIHTTYAFMLSVWFTADSDPDPMRI